MIEAGRARLVTMQPPAMRRTTSSSFSREPRASSPETTSSAREPRSSRRPTATWATISTTLERLRDLDLERIYTGHFRPLDGGLKVIENYIEHRRSRGSERSWRRFAPGPATVEEIVERVYADVSPALHPIAQYSVLAHLELLERAG